MYSPTAMAIGQKSTMRNIMRSWVGENIDTVIEYWGSPTEEKEIAGRKLFYWKSSYYHISSYDDGTIVGGEICCNRTLEVDKNNIVTHWQWTGNNCPWTYSSAKKLVNPNNNPWKKK